MLNIKNVDIKITKKHLLKYALKINNLKHEKTSMIFKELSNCLKADSKNESGHKNIILL
jgi:hypothetical protein